MHGLTHAVRDKKDSGGGYTTVCRRAYVKTLLDVPDRVVTCVWCVINKPWPSGVSIHNPCAEVWLPGGGKVPYDGE
jgi:hypothetical protein